MSVGMENPYAVGEELAVPVGFGGAWRVIKIEKITPSGRMKCGHWELNPDLTIRGRTDRWGPSRAYPITDEIRAQICRQKYLAKIESKVDWNKLSDEQLKRICEVLEQS